MTTGGDKTQFLLNSAENTLRSTVGGNVYANLHKIKSQPSSYLSDDFSSTVMFRIINEKLRRAKSVSTNVSFAISGFVALLVFLLFYFVSIFNWFQYEPSISLSFDSLSYILPCVISGGALVVLDQFFDSSQDGMSNFY